MQVFPNHLILLAGFKGSGKSTAAAILQQRGYAPLSFADAIKDMLASVFCWNRDWLEGVTPESRAWREAVDPWWATKLGIAHFSPRVAMQTIGTEVMRQHIHPELWVFNVERRMADLPARDVVLVDGRHRNEIAMARARGGLIVRIRRGPEPGWYDTALAANQGDEGARRWMIEHHQIHPSEWAWIGADVDVTIENDGDLPLLLARTTALIARRPH